MVMLIGYWRNDKHPVLPDPAEFVDPVWDADERELVVQYLHAGTVARTFMGFSACRICGVANGALELTDGEYAWPDGLSHYISDHGVRPPQVVVEHILKKTADFELAEFDLSMWQMATRSSDVATPPPERTEVKAVIDQVLSGSISRDTASRWAMRWVGADDPGIDDEVVWDALTSIGGMDLTHGEGQPFLHSDDQLREWRDRLG